MIRLSFPVKSSSVLLIMFTSISCSIVGLFLISRLMIVYELLSMLDDTLAVKCVAGFMLSEE
jgi:hypothetical protein